MRRVQTGVAMVFAMASAAVAGSPTIFEDFGIDSAGFSIVDIQCGGPYTAQGAAPAVTWVNAGGDPGSYIRAFDPSGNCFYFRASSLFSGNLSGYAGGRLSFSIKATTNTYNLERNVVLVGANGMVLVSQIAMPAVGSWNRRCVLLQPSLFRVGNASGPVATQGQFDAVLANVSSVLLPAEFGAAIKETVDLDSVELASGCLADLDFNGIVGSGDLNIILANFGTTNGYGDLDCNGTVNSTDLNALLAVFGEVCE